MATPIRSSIPAQTRRNQIAATFRPLIPSIARSVARRLPESFDTDDLEQIGELALLEEIPGIEARLRMRIESAMRNSSRSTNYREATHSHTVNLCSMPDPSRSVLVRLIAKERSVQVQNIVNCLPPDQVRAINESFSGEVQAGRPGQGRRGVEARKGIRVLRAALNPAA